MVCNAPVTHPFAINLGKHGDIFCAFLCFFESSSSVCCSTRQIDAGLSLWRCPPHGNLGRFAEAQKWWNQIWKGLMQSHASGFSSIIRYHRIIQYFKICRIMTWHGKVFYNSSTHSEISINLTCQHVQSRSPTMWNVKQHVWGTIPEVVQAGDHLHIRTHLAALLHVVTQKFHLLLFFHVGWNTFVTNQDAQEVPPATNLHIHIISYYRYYKL